jgi:hypothetical protein
MQEDPKETVTLPGIEVPGEQPDAVLPGADRPEPRPDPDDDLPERLGKRIERGPGAIAPGEPDMLPDVEVPDGQM